MAGRPLGEQASSLLRLSKQAGCLLSQCKQAGCLRSQCYTYNFLPQNILFFLMIRLLTVLLWGFALCQAGAVPAPAEDMRPCDKPDTVSCCQPAAKEACKPGSVKQKVKRTGSLLYRFIQSFDDYDTTYISPNYYNFTAMAQNTNYYQVYRLAGSDADGRTQTLYLKPAQSMKVGPYFGWRWIFLGYTFDVSHPHRLGKASEFNLSLYSSMIGLDFLYLRNAGDFRLRKAVGFEGVEPGSVYGHAGQHPHAQCLLRVQPQALFLSGSLQPEHRTAQELWLIHAGTRFQPPAHQDGLYQVARRAEGACGQ